MAPESDQIYVTVAARLIFRAMPWVVERPGAHCDLDGGSSNYGNFIGFDPSPYIYIYIYIGYMYIYICICIYMCVCVGMYYTHLYLCVCQYVYIFFWFKYVYTVSYYLSGGYRKGSRFIHLDCW